MNTKPSPIPWISPVTTNGCALISIVQPVMSYSDHAAISSPPPTISRGSTWRFINCPATYIDATIPIPRGISRIPASSTG